MSLERLVAPHTIDAFMSDFHERRYLHVQRNDAHYFADLRDDLHLEQQIWQHSAKWGDVSLARANTSPTGNIYAINPPTIDNVAAAFAAGYTVVVNNFQTKSLRIAEFCREIEKHFFFRCNVNLYFTDARCKGLDAHYDDQDVFVLQLEGEKTWRVYEGGPLLPLEDQEYACPDIAGLPFVELVLQPGDVLYLPRGFIHEAHTEAAHSLHVTLSVSAIRQVAFLKQLLQRAAENNVDLRRSIRSEHLRQMTSGLGKQEMSIIRDMISDLGASAVQQVFSDFQDRFLSNISRLPGEQMAIRAKVDTVEIESLVAVPKDQVCMVCDVDQKFTLKFIGGQVELSQDLLDTARFICETRMFHVCALAGDLSDAQKITFVQFLIGHGLLAQVPQEPAQKDHLTC